MDNTQQELDTVHQAMGTRTRTRPQPPWEQKYEAFRDTPDWQPTKLNPGEEQQFKQWLMNTPWFKNLYGRENADNDGQLNPVEFLDNVTGPDSDYDMRGAWKSGMSTTLDQHDGQLHWPDADNTGRMLKAPWHPAAWMQYFQENFGIDPEKLGLENYDQALEWANKRRRYQGHDAR